MQETFSQSYRKKRVKIESKFYLGFFETIMFVKKSWDQKLYAKFPVHFNLQQLHEIENTGAGQQIKRKK